MKNIHSCKFALIIFIIHGNSVHHYYVISFDILIHVEEWKWNWKIKRVIEKFFTWNSVGLPFCRGSWVVGVP